MIHHPSYFGKLPWSADFVSFDASGGTMRAMDLWLQESIRDGQERFGTGYEAALSSSPDLRIVLQPEGGSELVVGSVVASSDSRGRHYPFYVVYRLGSADLQTQETASVPLFVEPALRASSQIVSTARESIDDSERLRDLAAEGQIELEANVNVVDLVRDTPLRQFLDRTFGVTDGAEQRSLLIRLLSLTSGMKKRGVRPTAYAIGYPLNSSPETEVIDVAVWLSLTWWLLDQPNVQPNLVWTENQSPGRLWLFLGPPGSFVYPFGACSGLPDSPIYDLDEADQGSTDTSDLPGVFDDTEITIGDLVANPIEHWMSPESK